MGTGKFDLRNLTSNQKQELYSVMEHKYRLRKYRDFPNDDFMYINSMYYM